SEWTSGVARDRTALLAFHHPTWPTADPDRVAADDAGIAEYVRTIGGTPTRAAVMAWIVSARGQMAQQNA
ncbi:MAG: hypothetical protein ABI743_11030, partial [bacterium]